jgi:serine O-acetyltransferase
MLMRLIVKTCGGAWLIRRKHTECKSKFVKAIYDFLYTYSLKSNGSWISLAARFSGEPCFPHGILGIFISGGAVVGSNCVIFQHVTIGSNTLIDSRNLGAPTIGDNCYIGTGARIIGNVKVGNNVRIGANTVVYQNVPDNCVVISGVQKVIQKTQTLNNKFYHEHNGQWRFFDDGRWNCVEEPSELCLLNRLFRNQ